MNLSMLSKTLFSKISPIHFSRYLFIFLLCVSSFTNAQQDTDQQPEVDQGAFSFVSLLLFPDRELEVSLKYIKKNWQPGYAAMALDVLALARRQYVRSELIRLLKKHSDQDHKDDLNAWLRWLWNQPEEKYEHYAEFKSLLYGLVDEKFKGYFNDEREVTIRLDEVRWGGVAQDGIPPLRSPEMISVKDAVYLNDEDVVFGIEINGDARAYPKRILAWHEMFVDEVGGVNYAGVYCTLCGAVILYETLHEGVQHEMGTSGFLYRSNKLMYDKATQSMWSTTRGEPVNGPLVGKGIALQRSFVVTTTWGEWKRRHPDTTVLSLNTGHRRDYGEGVAYQSYFATDDLMFTVPNVDSRLKNKDEILALTFPKSSDEKLAIFEGFLANNPVYHDRVGPVEFVVLTDKSGANRVYENGDVEFASFDQDSIATDKSGIKWTMAEDQLTSSEGEILKRLPAHRAFWFGWYAAHNDTRLVYQ